MTTPPDPTPMQRLAMPLMASFSLGLAPFFPEPHIVGKIRWVLGGANGMGPVDWGDLAMHGAPWVWLLVTALMVAKEKFSQSASATPST